MCIRDRCVAEELLFNLLLQYPLKSSAEQQTRPELKQGQSSLQQTVICLYSSGQTAGGSCTGYGNGIVYMMKALSKIVF